MRIKRIIDISRRIYSGMVVWPDGENTELKSEMSVKKGDICNVTLMSMSVHNGTHIDSPLHFLDGARSITEADLSRFIGFAKVFEIDTKDCINESHLKDLMIEEGDAVFFKTSNSNIPEEQPFVEGYVYLDASAARYLADKKVRTVGFDYLSIDKYGDKNYPAHMLLLKENVGIIETICLKGVQSGDYFFSCLPLKIEGSEGSPARAVLLELE